MQNFSFFQFVEGCAGHGFDTQIHLAQPRLSVAGQLSLAGTAYDVSGVVWMEHQWLSPKSGDTASWNWFAIQFDDASGHNIFLTANDLPWTHAEPRTSPKTGIVYPGRRTHRGHMRGRAAAWRGLDRDGGVFGTVALKGAQLSSHDADDVAMANQISLEKVPTSASETAALADQAGNGDGVVSRDELASYVVEAEPNLEERSAYESGENFNRNYIEGLARKAGITTPAETLANKARPDAERILEKMNDTPAEHVRDAIDAILSPLAFLKILTWFKKTR